MGLRGELKYIINPLKPYKEIFSSIFMEQIGHIYKIPSGQGMSELLQGKLKQAGFYIDHEEGLVSSSEITYTIKTSQNSVEGWGKVYLEQEIIETHEIPTLDKFLLDLNLENL